MVLRLLYFGLSPIQNSKPYTIMMQQDKISTTVLYVEPLHRTDNKAIENITKQAFTDLKKTNYPEYYLTETFLHKTIFSKWVEIKKWVKANDVLVIYGHYHIAFKLAIILAKLFRKRLILTNDATYTQGNFESKGVLLQLKPLFFKFLYNFLSDAVFVPSTAAKQFLLQNGVKENKIVITPYVVDEDSIISKAAQTDITAIRQKHGATNEDTVFVFCAKFIERKKPLDAINAFAKINNSKAKLWMIGHGPMYKAMQQRIETLQLETKVFLLGIINYNQLPDYYKAADCLVFTSEHEPYGLPVNEAMLCSIPVIVSDKIGARLDLVEQDKTGWIYPVGNLQSLATCMEQALQKNKIKLMGEQAFMKMKTWSSEINVQQQINFFKQKDWLNL